MLSRSCTWYTLAALLLLSLLLMLLLASQQRPAVQLRLQAARASDLEFSPTNLTLSSLLLYRSDSESLQFLRQQWQSGEMLRLVKRVAPGAKQLRHFAPTLTLDGYNFSTFDGRRLDARQVVAQLQSPGRDAANQIPNAVHSFAFSKSSATYQLTFKSYLGLVSALWLSGARRLVIWCNRRPVGQYWRMFAGNVTATGQGRRVLFASRPLPRSVFGRPLSRSYFEHSIDVMKLEVAILIGGIFLDNDAVTLRSLRPLRRHSCFIGKENPGALTIGMFGCKPSPKFQLLWYTLYQQYYANQWGKMSVELPGVIWQRFPSLCRVEETTVARPTYSGAELKLLYGNKSTLERLWNWKRNYIVHLWDTGVAQRDAAIRSHVTALKMDSMYGDIARFVVNGSACGSVA